jgi:preprotein translocase subunit SecF
MIRLFANASYDFIAKRRWAYGLTALFVVPGLALLLVRGFKQSIEFTGGTLIQVRTTDTVGTAALRDALHRGGIVDAEIQGFGSPVDYQIRARLSPADTASDASAEATGRVVRAALTAALGPEGEAFRVTLTEAVGPKVGQELQTKALLAILASFGAVLVYLAVRFEWRFGLAAVIATAHDILATAVFTRYLDLEISLVIVAAFLTMVGYSLNDTIIIFDRVRENLRKFKRKDLPRILNLSINQTLPRSILTHATTAATLFALLLFAGETVRPFAWVMTFGVITGTFSSIFIAAPILLLIENRWPGQDARGARLLLDEHPGGGGGGGPEPVLPPSGGPRISTPVGGGSGGGGGRAR